MGNCKDCKFWRSGECDKVDWIGEEEVVYVDSAAMYADAADDTNLRCGLKTGPMFGCVSFQQSEKHYDAL